MKIKNAGIRALLTALTIAFGVPAPAQTPQNIVITSAASFQAGLPPKGSLGTIFCTGLQVQGTIGATTIPLPRTLSGVSVTIGGAPAPLLAVASQGTYQMINFQVPREPFSAAIAPRRSPLRRTAIEDRRKRFSRLLLATSS